MRTFLQDRVKREIIENARVVLFMRNMRLQEPADQIGLTLFRPNAVLLRLMTCKDV